jgi:phosphohistidine phosphatase
MGLTLMLLRHAKAKRPEDGVEDFDRKLSRRGREAATELGKLMREEKLAPDLALVSSAKRTCQTWQRVSEELGTNVPAREARALYLAGPARIMDAVRRSPAEARRVVVVGHNPGMENLCARLVGESREFPTCALAIIAFDGEDWRQVERGRLERFIAT